MGVKKTTIPKEVSCGLGKTALEFPLGVQSAYRKATFSGGGDIVLASFICTRKKSIQKILEKLVKEIH